MKFSLSVESRDDGSVHAVGNYQSSAGKAAFDLTFPNLATAVEKTIAAAPEILEKAMAAAARK